MRLWVEPHVLVIKYIIPILRYISLREDILATLFVSKRRLRFRWRTKVKACWPIIIWTTTPPSSHRLSENLKSSHGFVTIFWQHNNRPSYLERGRCPLRVNRRYLYINISRPEDGWTARQTDRHTRWDTHTERERERERERCLAVIWQ